VTLAEIARRSLSLGARPLLWSISHFPSGLLWRIARFLRWCAPMVFFGALLGAMTVLFPPGVPVAVFGLFVAALVWAMPELADAPTKLLRKSFFVAVAVCISVPAYYAVQLEGLPWISVRRIALLTLICLLLFILGGSHAQRNKLISVLRSNMPLCICAIGYLCMAVTSIVTSTHITASMSAFIDVILTWYLPLIACLTVIETEDDIVFLLRLIVSCSLIVEITGVAEFITERRLAFEVLPGRLLQSLLFSNETMADTLNHDPHRNGYYRAISTYLSPLSYGEFAAMVAPIGIFFLFHGRRLSDRFLGVAVFVGAVLSLFVAGSRGGFIGLILACGVLSGLMVIRWSRLMPQTLVGAIGSLVALAGVASVMTTILLWKRLYNIVFGGGDTVASSQGRVDQWLQAKKWIFSNPVTGHGLGLGPEIVDYRLPSGALTLDSYLINLLVETGVPGFLFYMGAIGLAIFFCARVYIRNLDRLGTLGGPLAASFITYGFYRAALSQRDNQTFYFLMLGIAFVYLKLARDAESKAVERGAAEIQILPPITPPRQRMLQRGRGANVQQR